MNCKKALSLISEYIDGCLTPSEQLSLEAHLDRCEKCASELSKMRRMLLSLGSLSKHKSPVNCWAHVQAIIVNKTPLHRAWWTYVLKPVVAAPALALTLLIALFLILPGPVEQNPTDQLKKIAPEYSYYIGAHSRLQRQQSLTDPDVTFVRAELEKASFNTNSDRP